MPGKYWLEIYGCQMNFAEGYALESELKKLGWKQAGTAEEADVAILHTCSVRQTAENRIWGRLGFFKHIKQSKHQKLIVMGCMAERLKNEIVQREPSVDLVVGNYHKEYLADIIDGLQDQDISHAERKEAFLKHEKEFRFQKLHYRENDFHAYLPIMHGCNNFCTYCIVPYVRGREISRSPEEILDEISQLESRGVKEISLLGQNVNSYSYQDGRTKVDFPDILERILDHSRDIEWIRFITSHPKDVPPRLIDLIQEQPRICRHVHLPVQHGSSSVLQRMNRKYSREDFLDLVRRMKEKVPGISLTTDILIGFPGEGEKDFQDTLSLLREVRFDDAFMYYYNVREGTPAAQFDDQLPKELKLERLDEVIQLQRSISHEIRMQRIGTVEKVLAESVSRRNSSELLGRTERDQMTVFPGTKAQIGGFFHVRLEELHGNTFKGSICEEPEA